MAASTALFRDSGQALALGNLSYPSSERLVEEVDMNVNFRDYVCSLNELNELHPCAFDFTELIFFTEDNFKKRPFI